MSRVISLWLRLNRFAAENQKKKIDWDDTGDYKWFILYDYEHYELDTNFNTALKHITVYFDSEETAEKAIEEFREDLIGILPNSKIQESFKEV